MGAYIYYRLKNPSKAPEANKRTRELLPKNLHEEVLDHLSQIHFNSEEDKQWWLEDFDRLPEYFELGKGEFKVSSLPLEHKETITDILLDIFEQLHEEFEIEVYGKSCALSINENGEFYYFEPDEIKKITDNGNALTGSNAEKITNAINA